MLLMCCIVKKACRAAEAVPDARHDCQLRHMELVYRAKPPPSDLNRSKSAASVKCAAGRCTAWCSAVPHLGQHRPPRRQLQVGESLPAKLQK
jgi:hypothetical protein